MSHQEGRQRYKSKRYYAKANVMINEVCAIDKVETPVSNKDLSDLVRSIQTDDLDLLESILNATNGKNISERLVQAQLPKKWHHVAKNVMSTPLRTAVSWRNIKALGLILESKCIVAPEDLLAGLLLVLRHVNSEVETELISRLVRTGEVRLEGPVPLTLGFEKLLDIERKSDEQRARNIVEILTGQAASNHLRGMVLLAVSKHSAKYLTKVSRATTHMPDDTQWSAFTNSSMKTIFETTFSPADFIKDAGMWLSLGSVSFQHIIHALPMMVHAMAGECPVEALGWLLRHVSRVYPQCNDQGKDKIHRLPNLMFEAGMDLPKLLSVACLSPRFLDTTGFSYWSARRRTELRSLQQLCRVAVRNHVTTGNVYYGMEHITGVPTALRQFILLTDVQSLPWSGAQ